MKKLLCLFLFAITTIAFSNATGSPAKKITGADPSATLQKMWIDYDATQDGRDGMMMHVAFTVYNMKGMEGVLGCYFKYSDSKPDSYIKHTGNTNVFHSSNFILSVRKLLVPNYEASVYDDMELFMPYDEFNLAPGEHAITIDVQFQTKAGVGIAWLKLYDIIYTEPESSRSANKKFFTVKNKPLLTTGPRATFDSLWVDYDVKENDVLGMMLHFKFTAYDMKDTQAAVAVYFEYNDERGGILKDKNQQYSSSGGDVAVYKDVKPGFSPAYYDDLQVFMPYNELDLAPGTYQLLMDTKLIYSRGGLIANFTLQGFRYTK
ncbi:MAG: hypothetical protein ABI688_04485 [Bacteroidota bacterium]